MVFVGPGRSLKILFLFHLVAMLMATTQSASVTYLPKQEKKTRDEGDGLCGANGGRLARIQDPATLEKAKEAIAAVGSSEKYFTGLRYHKKHGFTWSGNDRVSASSNDLNAVAEQKNPNGRKCYVIKKNKEKMEQDDCEHEHFYLCEKDVVQASSTTTTTTTTTTTKTSVSPTSVVLSETTTSSTSSRLLATTSSYGVLSRTDTAINTLAEETTTRVVLSAIETTRLTTLTTTPARDTLSAVKTTSAAPSAIETTSLTTLTTTPAVKTTSAVLSATLTSTVLTTTAGNVLPVATSSNELLVEATTTVVFSSVSSETTNATSKEPLSAQNQLLLYQAQIKALNTSEESSLQTAVNVTSRFLKSFEDETIEKNDINVLLATQELETFALNYGKAQLETNKDKDLSVTDQYFALNIQKVAADSKEHVTFPAPNETNYPEGEGSASISLPAGLFKGQESVIVSILFKTIDRLVPDGSVLELDGKNLKNSRIGSRIISSAVDPHSTGVLKENVTISFSYEEDLKEADIPHCVFWNFSARGENSEFENYPKYRSNGKINTTQKTEDKKTTFNGSWSSHGCSLVKSTKHKIVCSCNHLTNFGILMQVGESKIPSKHKEALEIITYIGCGLSLVGEFLTIITYCIFMNLKQEQSQIRLNLVIALATAQIVFLSGIEASDNKGACIFVAALIHFFYLAGFAWMLFEGVFLYLMVVKVFNTVIRMRLFYAVAWGLPFLVVVTSLVIASTNEGGVSSYVHGDFCWVSFSNNLIWTFATPVLVVCLINSVILARVVYEITTMQSARTSDAERARQGLKACAVLFPLLGMTWVFGILSVTDAGLVFQYLFTILNSLQGFFIFVFHVLRSSEIHAAVLRKKQKWKQAKSFGTSRSTANNSLAIHSETAEEKMTGDENYEFSPRRNQVSPHKFDHQETITKDRSLTPVDM